MYSNDNMNVKSKFKDVNWNNWNQEALWLVSFKACSAFTLENSDDDDDDDNECNEKGKYSLNLLSKYFHRFEPFLSLIE